MRIRDHDFNVLVLNGEAEETVAMVHGIFTNLSVFYLVIAQELARRYRVVLYDLRGHGLSETAASGYDLRSMSDDLLAILSELGISRVHLAGYSYGGLVALHTALHRPEAVDKLIVIETPDLNDGQPRPLLEGYDRVYLDRYLQELSRSTTMAVSARKIEKTHRQVQYLFEHTTLKEDLARDRDLFARIADHPFPHETLLLYARRTECANAAEFLHRRLSRSTLHYGEGDHSIPVQNPRWIADRILEFL
jgi:pimeloyl-ACP methyl ester carboxylesterase